MYPAGNVDWRARRAPERRHVRPTTLDARILRFVTAVHASIYTTMLILSGGLALWALFFMITGRPVDGAYRATFVLGIGVAVLQGVLGLYMVFVDGLRPGQTFHYLYGISLIVFTGFGYALATRTSSANREALVLGISAAAAFGLILRASATA